MESRPWARTAWEFTVGDRPSLWSGSPVSPAEVVRYAAAGEWCSAESRFWRTAGRVWCALVAVPVTVAAHVLAWVVQRPGRAGAVAFLIAMFWLFL